MSPRFHQILLIISTLVLSWLGMMLMHELGHVLGAVVTGGRVQRVVFHPLAFSRTDVYPNPRPLIVAWAGPLVGVTFPMFAWLMARSLRLSWTFLLRFFAGFCLIANGAYIGVASFTSAADAGDMLRHGSPRWTLWLFGCLAVAAGLTLWHRLGAYFGLGLSARAVNPRLAYVTAALCIAMIVVGAVWGGW